MPRGKWTGYKGRNRRFTNPDELEQERIRDQKEKSWKAKIRDLPPSESDEGESDEGEDDENSEESDSDDSENSDDTSGKAKGVEGLIAVENPNRVQKKTKKVSTITENDNPQLSRREREEVEKQKAALHYQKLHAEGKTEEARADLARLAIIKQQREEAAKKRELEKKEKEIAKQSKTAESLKAIGKY